MNFNFFTEKNIKERTFELGEKTWFAKETFITTFVEIEKSRETFVSSATCDKLYYHERDGILNAIANLVCDGNFDKVYNSYLRENERQRKAQCKCSYCGKVYSKPKEARNCEKAHIENKKRKNRERWLKTEAKRRYKKLLEEIEIAEHRYKELFEKIEIAERRCKKLLEEIDIKECTEQLVKKDLK